MPKRSHTYNLGSKIRLSPSESVRIVAQSRDAIWFRERGRKGIHELSREDFEAFLEQRKNQEGA